MIMSLAVGRRVCAAVLALTALVPSAAQASYLFWYPPLFESAAVRGDEAGLGQEMPGATQKEVRAHLLWNMRAGLNVAALQCQFSPILQTVPNYNDMLKQHGKELAEAYTAVSGYFQRTIKSGWQTKFDQYTTRTYQGFSTMYAQLGFCDTAASIGREALSRPKGKLYLTAENRMREFRNSLVPAQDRLFTVRRDVPLLPTPSFDPKCWDKKDHLRDRCATLYASTPAAAPFQNAPAAAIPSPVAQPQSASTQLPLDASVLQ
jgi:hypothetical protein